MLSETLTLYKMYNDMPLLFTYIIKYKNKRESWGIYIYIG